MYLLLLGLLVPGICLGAGSPPPVINVQPLSQSVLLNDSVTFSVSASSSTTLSYQWIKDGVNISGATLSNYTIVNVQTNHQGTYKVKVTNSGGNVTSSNAILTVLIPPVITTQPQNQTVPLGASASFSVVAIGASPISYQWRFNGSPLSGATSSSLALTNIQVTDAGSYQVVMTNLYGSATSAVAALAINYPPIAIDDVYSIPEDNTLNVAAASGVLSNDSDPNGDPLLALLVSTTSNGLLTLNTNGSFSYRPATNYFGSDSFTYRTRDGTFTSSVATVSITVTPVNDAPVAYNQNVTNVEDTATNLVVVATDVDSTGLVYSILAGPTNGALISFNSSNGAVTYLPATNASGADTFTFTAFDGSLYATGRVTLTITPVNDVPVTAMPLAVAGTEDVPLIFSPANGNSISVAAPDSAANPIELSLWAPNGTVTLNGISGLTFTSGDGFADASMTFRGPLLYLNAALNGLTFRPSTNFNGSTLLTIQAVHDKLVAVNYDANFVGRYSFEDPSTANTLGTNSSPASGNNGTLKGAIAAVDATRGNVLSLDGLAGDNVKINGRFGNPINVTLAAWVNLTVAAVNGSEVISLGDSAALRLDDAGKLKGIMYNGSSWKEVTYTTTFQGAGWHHVAYTFNDTANLQKLYVDGVMVTSKGEGGTISYTLGGNSYIGVHGDGGTTHNFTGLMDEVRVYTRALTDQEIATLATDLSLSTTNSTTIILAPVNDPPVAVNNPFSVAEDTELNISAPGILANDVEVDGDAFTAVLVSNVSHGALALDADGSFIYMPVTNYNGSDSFSYAATDGVLTGNVATVTINVIPVNNVPVALSQSLTSPEETSLAITLTSTDADGPVTNFTIVTLPTSGTLTGSGANRTYIPANNFFGSDSFTFKVNDGTLTSAVATVSLTITPVNDVPIAFSQNLTNNEDTALAITLTGTDVDGPVTNFTLVTLPANGTLSGTPPNLIYLPATNYSRSDSFTFTINDGSLTSAVATITITNRPVNDVPLAFNQNLTTPEDTALPITLTSFDVDGPVTNFVIVTLPTSGTLTGSGASRSYLPNTNFFGSDSFTFRVNDGSLTSVVATISLTVTPVNDAPIAFSQNLTNNEDTALAITLTVVDVDGPVTNFTIIALPANGTLTGSGANRSYLPNTNFFGSDSFTFRVNDGSLTSAVATITITNRPVNDVPIAFNQNLTTPEDTTLPITLTSIDVDGPVTNFTTVTLPANGTLTGSGASRSYLPNTNFFGSDNFTFRVNDGSLTSVLATVSLTITPVNDAPVAFADSALAYENYNVIIPVLSNDIDVDGDPLTIVGTSTTNGTAVISGTNIVFTPATNFFGTVVFSYTASDGILTSNANVTVTVIDTTNHFLLQTGTTNYNGSAANSSDLLQAVALDVQGNVYVTGYAKEAASGSYDYVTLKYSPAGALLWRAVYEAGFGKDDLASALALDSAGNVYVTGNSGNAGGVEDYATVKYDSNGNQLWVARYDGGLNKVEKATGVAVDTNGNVFVTGYGINAIGKNQYVTIKYNGAGQGVWTNVYNGPAVSADLANGIALDSAGDVYVIGQSQGIGSGYDYATVKYSNAGIQQWVARYNGPGNDEDNAVALVVDAAANIYVTGSSINAAGNADYATVKYDTSGNQLWIARYNGPAGKNDNATRLVVDSTGNVFVTGTSTAPNNTTDYATLKYNPLGQQQWVQRFDAGDDDTGAALALDPSGDVYVTGSSKISGFDFATVKYLTANGSLQGVARFNSGGSVNDTAIGIAIDSQYNVYVAGQGYSPLDYVLVKYVPTYRAAFAPPIAVNDVTNANKNFNVTIPVMANDTQPGGGLMWIIRTATTNGTAAIVGTNVVFTPDTNFVGTVVFSYTISDGTNTTVALVTVNVLETLLSFGQPWATNYNGSAANSADFLQAVAVDAQGNVYVTGYAKEAASASYDYVTLKYSPSGVLLWRAVYDGAGKDDFASALTLDSAGNVYVTGQSSPNNGTGQMDYNTVKYDSNGNQLWVARYVGLPGKVSTATGVAVDANGNVFVTGSTINAISKNQYVTIKYNSAGQSVWTNTYVGPALAGDLATGIALDPSGNVYVTGQSAGIGSGNDYATIKYSNDGLQLWVARYNGPGNSSDNAVALIVDAAANVYVTGNSLNAAGNADYATVKYDTNGNQLWVARYDGPAGKNDFAARVAVDSAGNVFVTGTSSSPGSLAPDYATLKYNSLGQQQWVQRYDFGDDDQAASLALDASGDVYVTGSSKSSTGYDFATIKYLSVDGSQQGVARFNSAGTLNDTAVGLAIDNQYNVYVAGQGFSPLDYVLVKNQPLLHPPIVSAPSVSQITTNAAFFTANVNPQGAPTACYFQYGVTTNYGSFSLASALGSGNNIVAMAASVTGLIPGTLYHCRVVAFNTIGVTLGENSTFTTIGTFEGPPAILTPPQSQTVSSGQNVDLNVVATGPGPLNYQWSYNGNPLSGATSSSLTLTNVRAANAGNYSVLVFNGGGSTSSAAIVTVTNPPCMLSIPDSAGNPANGFVFRLSVPVGSTYVILASTNLQDWTPIYTNVAWTATVILTDSTSTNYSRRFYRTAVLNP